jgi:hypothetical protein
MIRSLLACLRTAAALVALFVVGSASYACSKSSQNKPEPTGGVPLLGADCDPMVPSRCGFPSPSSVYLADDPTTPTGKRVAFGATTLPAYTLEHPLDPAAWSDLDGFSPGMAPMTHMPGATIAGLPTQDSIDLSLTADSPTILLEADTGARVPHWAELDVSVPFPETQAFMIHPAVRLKDGARYIVAIRRVVDASGAALPPSPVFRALRDGTDLDDPSVRRRRALYADIFARLASAGIAKGDLQIAWDYVTASREGTTKRMIAMRDDALAKVGADGPPYVITNVEEKPNPYIRRRITGKMTVPFYLDKQDVGGRLVLGPDGLPRQNGTADFEFVVHVPESLASAAAPKAGPLVQNGHGLLGSMREGQNGYLAEFADVKGYVAFSMDLFGMAGGETSFIADTLFADATNFRSTIDRQHQGIVNELLLMRMMKGRFVKEPLVQFGGVSVIDPTEAYYRGDSQGGIFGATYMAISTDVTRGLLGEPGMPYTLLFNRSVDFTGFGAILHVTYRNPLDVQILFGLVQMLWDRTEPDGYAPYITESMLPGTPAHQVLIHVAIGDHQVSPLGAHLIARSVHAKNVTPVNRHVWGLDEASAPLSGTSAMVEYDFGLPLSPSTNLPPSGDGDPHDSLRVLPQAETQADEFFRTGVVNQHCAAACRPE